jgi:hypothetical protein
MHKTKRELYDYIPYLMICSSLAISLILMLVIGFTVQWQHYLGLLFLGFNGLLFRKNHKQGVLFLGLTLILGIMGWLAFQVGIVGGSMHFNINDFRIPVFARNPILLLVFILHFIPSNRFYDGILAKKYWTHINHPDWIWKNQNDFDRI